MYTSALTSALRVDLCLTEGQLLRHFGLKLEQLDSRLYVLNACIGQTAESIQKIPTRFVSLYNHRVDATVLRHWAATAEVRHQLNIDLESWAAVRTQGPVMLPDAVWYRGKERIAVEVDTASYRPGVVLEKLRHFGSSFDGLIWAATSQRRANSLALRYGLEALVVNWQ